MSKETDQQPATGLAFLQKAAAAGGLGKGIGQTLRLAIDAVDDGLVSLCGTPGLVCPHGVIRV